MALTPTRLEHQRRWLEGVRAMRRNQPDPTPFLHVGIVLMGCAIVLLCVDKGVPISI